MKEILIFIGIKLVLDLFIRLSKRTANTIDDEIAQWLSMSFGIVKEAIKPILKKRK